MKRCCTYCEPCFLALISLMSRKTRLKMSSITQLKYFMFIFPVSDDEYRALRHHIKSPPGSPRSQSPTRSPRSRRRGKTLSLNLRPPIIIEKGPRGYGFTLQAIRVYFGDTNYYKVHHLVSVSNHAICLFAFLLLTCSLVRYSVYSENF